MVNEKRMRETFEELVRIYAPSKGELLSPFLFHQVLQFQ